MEQTRAGAALGSTGTVLQDLRHQRNYVWLMPGRKCHRLDHVHVQRWLLRGRREVQPVQDVQRLCVHGQRMLERK